MLNTPGALEDEIAIWIVERAELVAQHYFDANEPPPTGDDLFHRAVRGVHARLVARRDAARAAEKQRANAAIAAERQRTDAATDVLIARIRAGEDVEL